MAEYLLAAFLLLLTPAGFGYCLSGVTLGIVVGAIPGLNGSMLIALSLPLTLYMDPQLAMVLLVSMYVGSVSGALVAAILLKIPGTPAAIITVLDGYPMAQQGQAGRALALGVGASLVGGAISWLFLLFLAPELARWSVNFGPWEFFMLMLMALVLIAAVSQGAFVKGMLAGFFGILASLPGIDSATGVLRLNFGIDDLAGGLGILPVLLGVFALGQLFSDAMDGKQITRVGFRGFAPMLSLRDWRRHGPNLVRSSVIGTFIGILPGIGASVASIVAYTTARNVSKTPQEFGKGSEAGVVASEAANNASVGGALVPLVAMGIPGSVIDAILLGALIMHGFAPGPLLYTNNPELVYAIVASMLFACVLMFVIMTLAAGTLARLADVPRYLLYPAIIVACVLGAFASGNKSFDAWVMLFFGCVGFIMLRTGIPTGPFVIGFILAPKAEYALRSGLQASAGSFSPLLQRPIAISFLLISIVLLVWPLYRDWRLARRAPPARG